MKDLYGREIDPSNETIFDPKFKGPKENRRTDVPVVIKYEEQDYTEMVQSTADFMEAIAGGH